MFILCRAAKNEPSKRAQAFLLGTPWHCRPSKCVGEKDIIFLVHLSPQSHHERQIRRAKSYAVFLRVLGKHKHKTLCAAMCGRKESCLKFCDAFATVQTFFALIFLFNTLHLSLLFVIMKPTTPKHPRGAERTRYETL